MEQFLNLLIVDRRRRTALIQTVDRRWMLPVVACGERARAPLVATRWLTARAVTGVVAGEWLGRIAPDGRSIDWLIAITADPPVESPPFSWASIDGLEASKAVADYQAWAVDRVVTRGGIAVSGPFGALDWIDHARSWIESTGLTGLSNPVCFRASANDTVLGIRHGSAEVYFKGSAPNRGSDLHAMAAAARALPDSFPRTLALEESTDATRWLIEGCAGVPLARLCLDDDAVRVASDIGRLQRRLSPESPPSTLSLSDTLADAGGPLEAAWSDAVRRAFDEVISLPSGWTPLDLDPSNVFVDGPRIRYIDLEPRITAVPMALSVFARRLGASGKLLQALRCAYESTLRERIPWQAVDLVSEVTEIVTGWRRVLRNVECGEVTGPLDGVARAARRRLISVKALV
jgi:hypothetical protein